VTDGDGGGGSCDGRRFFVTNDDADLTDLDKFKGKCLTKNLLTGMAA
jgi:hypothetical protein